MQDVTIDPIVDNTTSINDQFLNKNIRDALNLLMRPPTCMVQKTNTQSIANGAGWTAIVWNYMVADTDPTMWSSGTNPSRVTIHTPGWYEITGGWGANLASNYSLEVVFRKNGNASYVYSGDAGTACNAMPVIVNFSTLIEFTTDGDYVEMLAKHSYTSAVTTGNWWNMPAMQVKRVRGI